MAALQTTLWLCGEPRSRLLQQQNRLLVLWPLLVVVGTHQALALSSQEVAVEVLLPLPPPLPLLRPLSRALQRLFHGRLQVHHSQVPLHQLQGAAARLLLLPPWRMTGWNQLLSELEWEERGVAWNNPVFLTKML